MRRIVLKMHKYITAVGLSAFLVFCGLTGVSSHVGVNASASDTNICAGACSSHTQHVATNSQLQKEEDDNEPTPPPYSWPSEGLNLTLLYIPLAISAFWILTRQKLFHLSVQMRF